MASQLHRAMKDASHDQQAGLHPIDQEVARAPHNLGRRCDVMPTQPQVPGPDAGPELRALDAPGSMGIACQVTKGRDDETLVPQARWLAELLVCPPEDLLDVRLGRARQAIPDHQASEPVFDAARRPSWPMKSSS